MKECGRIPFWVLPFLSMVKLYLCEDDSIQLEYYAGLLRRLISENSQTADFQGAYPDPEAFLEGVVDSLSEEDGALFFLDICLPEASMDGLELAGILRKRYPASQIVFLTSEAQYAVQTYEYRLEVLDYLVKEPLDLLASDEEKLQNRLQNILKRCLEKEKYGSYREQKKIKLGTKEGYICLDPESVFCANAVKERHQIELYLDHRKILSPVTLDQAKNCLGDGFRFCNKSCLVNLKKIRSVDLKERFLWLENGMRCEISFREVQFFKKYGRQQGG